MHRSGARIHCVLNDGVGLTALTKTLCKTEAGNLEIRSSRELCSDISPPTLSFEIEFL